MSIFEPECVLAAYLKTKNLFERKKAEKDWSDSVDTRAVKWFRKQEGLEKDAPVDKALTAFKQLTFASHVVEYVNHTYKETHIHAGSKAAKDLLHKSPHHDLSPETPFFGPLFLPPPTSHVYKRSGSANITTDSLYLRWVHIVHPLYLPHIKTCPACESTKWTWEGWTTTGPRDVHGVRDEGLTIGYQLSCKACSKSIATTNPRFWAKFQHWEIPRGVPIFFHRTAVSRELFDLITQLRPKGTTGGIATHIKQLHLLEYRMRVAEFIQYFSARLEHELEKAETAKDLPRAKNDLANLSLLAFSDPYDKTGYNCKHISEDMVAEVYTLWSRGREMESTWFLRTRSGRILVLDATFKVQGRTTIVAVDGKRLKVMGGGLVQVLNERGESISWRLCMTQAGAEYSEILTDVGHRYRVLGENDPDQIIVDNCCHSRSSIQCAMPTSPVSLDLYHFRERFRASLLGGKKNPHNSAAAVGFDIVHAIVKCTARESPTGLAQYYSKEEQEERLQAVWDKWDQHGGVWSAASAEVFQNQFRHVRKGCLTRVREDLAADGSRIESSHKAWNDIQRTQPCGLPLFVEIAHDFVLRRNISIASLEKNLKPGTFDAFLFGSHHVGLTDHVARQWNLLCKRFKTYIKLRAAHCPDYQHPPVALLPELPQVKTDERFGIVGSLNTETFGGLFTVKEEIAEEAALLDEPIEPKVTATPSEDVVLAEQGIKASLRFMPSKSAVSVSKGFERNVDASNSSPASIPVCQNGNSVTADIAQPVVTTLPPTPPSSQALSLQTAALSSPSTVPGLIPASESDLVALDVVDLTTSTDMPPPSTDTVTALSERTAEKRKATADDVEDHPTTLGVPAVDQEHGVIYKRARITVPGVPSALSQSTIGGTSYQSLFGVSKSQKPKSTGKDSEFRPVTRPPKHVPAGESVSAVSSALAHASVNMRRKRTVSELSRPFPYPTELVEGRRLTRSERYFYLSTNVHSSSLRIEGGVELYLFMDMRAEFKWASFLMSPKAWVKATELYNERLQAKMRPTTTTFIPKNPRALTDSCAWIEKEVLARVQTRDYSSKRSGTIVFWKAACDAVNLGKDWESARAKSEPVEKARKRMTCSRCSAIMYPQKEGHPHNHGKGYCSDGAPVNFQYKDNNGKKKSVTNLSVPPWPQPAGLFKTSSKGGTQFHATVLLEKLHDAYQKIVEERVPSDNLPSEDHAFVAMLRARILVHTDGIVYFRLYPHVDNVDLAAVSSLINDINDEKCIQLSCISRAPSDPPEDEQPAAGPSQSDGDHIADSLRLAMDTELSNAPTPPHANATSPSVNPAPVSTPSSRSPSLSPGH